MQARQQAQNDKFHQGPARHELRGEGIKMEADLPDGV